MVAVVVTPSDVEKALRNSPEEYKKMHRMNTNHPMIAGCKLGAVFTNNNGEYYVYVGVNGRNRVYPCMAVRVSDGASRKMGPAFFAKVRKASLEG